MKIKPKTKVKWVFGKHTHFGIIIGTELKDGTTAAKGSWFIEDATQPRIYEMEKKTLKPIRRKKPKYNRKTKRYEGDEFYNYVTAEFEAALKRSKKLPNRLHRGKMFHLPTPQGDAHYVITRVNNKTCDVEWRAFQPDRQTDSALGKGGRFPKMRIFGYVDWSREKRLR